MKTHEEITEANKLIAEFMGYPFHGFSFSTPYRKLVRDNEETNQFTPEDLKFQSSWDWLMPVVEKIESLPLHKLIYGTSSSRFPSVYMYKDRCIIKDTGDKTNVNVFDGRGRLMATYGAVVEFIKWYNENKKQNEN